MSVLTVVHADSAVSSLFEIITSIVEVPRVEATQGFQDRSRSVADLAVDLHVMVVITIGVAHLELPCQVDRERRKTVE
ncbi:hypothetical protein ACWERI_38645 [Streptomyces collinus]